MLTKVYQLYMANVSLSYLTQLEMELLTCMTYTMNRGAIGAPSLHYFATILQGYRNFDLDVSSLALARNHAIEAE